MVAGVASKVCAMYGSKGRMRPKPKRSIKTIMKMVASSRRLDLFTRIDYTQGMIINKLYLWSRRIHRVAMWGVILLGLGMSGGGTVLHRQVEGEGIPSMIDVRLVRDLHNKISQPFALFLLIMMMTGVVMWGVPKILEFRRGKS